ncbi:hypothetical protein [Aliikangiella maris]|uniref:Uncharacterized protein n=2 Tax=Aliikangiella maris TaxID=3162458 RepID=A0ABV2BS29_9GAMM
MKIKESRPIKNCFDGSFMKEIVLDEPVDKAFIDYLGLTGELEYFGGFARPFYRIQRKQGYLLKGVEGNDYLRVYFLRSCLQEAIKFFEDYVNDYQGNGSCN